MQLGDLTDFSGRTGAVQMARVLRVACCVLRVASTVLSHPRNTQHVPRHAPWRRGAPGCVA